MIFSPKDPIVEIAVIAVIVDTTFQRNIVHILNFPIHKFVAVILPPKNILLKHVYDIFLQELFLSV
jgi:hypothetical protein